MSRWSLYTWKRDRRSLRRALPTLTVLAALLTTSAGVAAGAAGAVERDVLGAGGLTQIELSSFEGDASVRPLTTSALRDAGNVPGVRQVVADYSSGLYAEEEGTPDPARRGRALRRCGRRGRHCRRHWPLRRSGQPAQ